MQAIKISSSKVLANVSYTLSAVAVALLLFAAPAPAHAGPTPMGGCVAVDAAVGVALTNLAISVASKNPYAVATAGVTAAGAVGVMIATGCGTPPDLGAGATSGPPKGCGLNGQAC